MSAVTGAGWHSLLVLGSPARSLADPLTRLRITAPAGLNSEQLALLDFLILARAQRFVGFGPSTFSTYLREYRTLHGVPPQLSTLVNASKIGTDEVFARSARIAQAGGQAGSGREPDGGGQVGTTQR